VIITGCNTGIGYETALALALRGARLIMACRDLARAEPAAQRIRDAVAAAGKESNKAPKEAGDSQQQVSVMQLDLCSFASVRAFAAAVARCERKVDVLLCNAGAMMMQQKLTGDGCVLALCSPEGIARTRALL
jgi:protochlorophyllide reductase